MEHYTMEELREEIRRVEKENHNLHRVLLESMQENAELKNRIRILESRTRTVNMILPRQLNHTLKY